MDDAAQREGDQQAGHDLRFERLPIRQKGVQQHRQDGTGGQNLEPQVLGDQAAGVAHFAFAAARISRPRWTASGGRIAAIGLPWFRAETYDAVRAIMADDGLPPAFDHWLDRAQQIEHQLRRAGHAVIRVYLDTEEFPAFCRTRGHRIDAKGRSAYAAFRAFEMAKAKPGGHA